MTNNSSESYSQQKRDAHVNATNSLDYKDRLAAIDAKELQAAVDETRGCLVGGCVLNGFNSGTPLYCPVSSCNVKRNDFDGTTAANCISPVYKPESRYKY